MPKKPFSRHVFDLLVQLAMIGIGVLVTVMIVMWVQEKISLPAVAEDPAKGAPATDLPEKKTVPVPEPIPWEAVDEAVRNALFAAHTRAEEEAGYRMDAWTTELMHRVDNDFLEWYFNYWNQQMLGLKSIWYWSLNQLVDDEPPAIERITEEIQAEFAARVLRPRLAQLELERMTHEVMDIYAVELRKHLDAIPESFEITRQDWDRYLERYRRINFANVEGARSVDLTLKTFTVAGAGGAVLAGQRLRQVTGGMGGRVSQRFAGKTATKIASKTARKVSSKAGGTIAGAVSGSRE